jgi:hypothetical protein
MSEADNDSSSSSSGSNSPPTATIALVLTAIALVLIIIILFLTRRFKRNSNANKGTSALPSTELPSHRSMFLDRSHPAARITPFGSDSGCEIPAYAFDHEPGKNMRVALRRPDGAWEFVEQRTSPYSPYGMADPDAFPASSSASLLSTATSPSKPRTQKEEEMQRWQRKHLDVDCGAELMAPPPAYGQV